MRRRLTPWELGERRKQRKLILQRNEHMRRINDRLNWIRSERLVIGDCTDLASFKKLPQHEQGVRLLKRVAYLFGRQAFDPHKGPPDVFGEPGPGELALGFYLDELRDADLYLLTYPWYEIVDAGYAAETHPGSGMYEITAKGWEVVESKLVEVDFEMPF